MSQVIANSQPPPKAKPLTAAIMGFLFLVIYNMKQMNMKFMDRNTGSGSRCKTFPWDTYVVPSIEHSAIVSIHIALRSHFLNISSGGKGFSATEKIFWQLEIEKNLEKINMI
jgi:hypothetical protein